MPDPRHIDAGDDPRLAALMAWRQQLIDSGAVSRNAFKEAHLRLVLRSGRTDVAQIRAMLPGSVAEHAEDMARLLAELETQSGGAGESGSAASRHRAGVKEARVDSDADSERLFRPARPAEPAPRDTDEIQYRAGDFAAFAFGEQRGEVHTIGLRRRQRGRRKARCPRVDVAAVSAARRGGWNRGHLSGGQRGGQPAVFPGPGAHGRRHHLAPPPPTNDRRMPRCATTRCGSTPGPPPARRWPLNPSNTPRPCWSTRCATSRFARTTGRSSAGGTSRQR